MNRYPLQRMLSVRGLREDQAARLLRHAMDELDTALAFWEARREEVRECLEAMRGKQAELAAATLGRQASLGISLGLQREIAAWRGRMEEAEAVMFAAADAVEAARQACEWARLAYQARMKDKRKIESHRGVWEAEAAREAEAAEERELEESANPAARNPPTTETRSA